MWYSILISYLHEFDLKFLTWVRDRLSHVKHKVYSGMCWNVHIHNCGYMLFTLYFSDPFTVGQEVVAAFWLALRVSPSLRWKHTIGWFDREVLPKTNKLTSNPPKYTHTYCTWIHSFHGHWVTHDAIAGTVNVWQMCKPVIVVLEDIRTNTMLSCASECSNYS